MTRRDTMLAVVVALVWGVNFLAIHASLASFPPLLLVAVRFTLLAVPTLLFVPRPDVPWRWVIGYGAGFGIAQFTFLYTGMAAGMPTGLASLVLQASGPFTLVLGAVLLGEQVRRRQWLGLAIAAVGMGLVGVARAATAGALPFILVLLGALGWAFGNLSSRLARPSNPFTLVMWMSVVVPIPMLLLSLVFEGPQAIGTALAGAVTAAAIPAWLGLAYTVLIGTIVGSGLWSMLLTRYSAGVVGPFSMLVPIVGMGTAALVLGEIPQPLELAGAALVVGGVLWGGRAPARTAEPATPGSEELQAQPV